MTCGGERGTLWSAGSCKSKVWRAPLSLPPPSLPPSLPFFFRLSLPPPYSHSLTPCPLHTLTPLTPPPGEQLTLSLPTVRSPLAVTLQISAHLVSHFHPRTLTLPPLHTISLSLSHTITLPPPFVLTLYSCTLSLPNLMYMCVPCVQLHVHVRSAQRLWCHTYTGASPCLIDTCSICGIACTFCMYVHVCLYVVTHIMMKYMYFTTGGWVLYTHTRTHTHTQTHAHTHTHKHTHAHTHTHTGAQEASGTQPKWQWSTPPTPMLR